jgi:hypothetical protein
MRCQPFWQASRARLLNTNLNEEKAADKSFQRSRFGEARITRPRAEGRNRSGSGTFQLGGSQKG